MARLNWSDFAAKRFKAGLDRGVFYPGYEVRGVPWSGLVSINENTSKTMTPFFYEGLPYMVHKYEGGFSANISAYTYPDELLPYEGMGELQGVLPGVKATAQPDPGVFHLAYRTKIGDGSGNTEGGYHIHLIYNLSIISDAQTNRTMVDQVDPNLFSWSVFGRKMSLGTLGAPTNHIIINSTEIPEAKLLAFENVIYGSVGTNPLMPTIEQLTVLLSDI